MNKSQPSLYASSNTRLISFILSSHRNVSITTLSKNGQRVTFHLQGDIDFSEIVNRFLDGKNDKISIKRYWSVMDKLKELIFSAKESR